MIRSESADVEITELFHGLYLVKSTPRNIVVLVLEIEILRVWLVLHHQIGFDPNQLVSSQLSIRPEGRLIVSALRNVLFHVLLPFHILPVDIVLLIGETLDALEILVENVWALASQDLIPIVVLVLDTLGVTGDDLIHGV